MRQILLLQCENCSVNLIQVVLVYEVGGVEFNSNRSLKAKRSEGQEHRRERKPTTEEIIQQGERETHTLQGHTRIDDQTENAMARVGMCYVEPMRPGTFSSSHCEVDRSERTNGSGNNGRWCRHRRQQSCLNYTLPGVHLPAVVFSVLNSGGWVPTKQLRVCGFPSPRSIGTEGKLQGFREFHCVTGNTNPTHFHHRHTTIPNTLLHPSPLTMKYSGLLIASAALLLVVVACAIQPTEARLREGECEGQSEKNLIQPRRTNTVIRSQSSHVISYLTCCVSLSFVVVRCLVCLKRMADFGKALASLKDEEAIHNGIRKMCKSYTDKADKRFVRTQ